MNVDNTQDVSKERDFSEWKLLSGTDLASLRGTKNVELPQRGIKECFPDGSWLQAKRLQKAYEDRSEVISEPKVERKGSLSFGVWCSTLGKVQVSQTKGKCWDRFGHYEDGQLYLNPEEALYLLDIGYIEITYGSLPISLQQAYSAFFQRGNFSLSDYQVYAHLNRLGFVVQRHKRFEKSLGGKKRKDVHPHTAKDKKFKTADDSDTGENISEVDATQPQLCSSLMSQESDYKDSLTDSEYLLSSTRFDDSCTGVSAGHIRHLEGSQSARQYSVWDFNAINLPDIANKTGIFVVPLMGNSSLLPKNISQDMEYSIDIDRYRITSNRSGISRKPQPETEFSYQDYTKWKTSSSNARTWHELKRELRERKPEFISPVSHLWTDEVTPLIKPEDGVSTGAVLEKLQVIKSVSVSKEDPALLCRNEFQIKFDVYPPGGKYKKSKPGVPAFRVCTTSFTDTPPDLCDIASIIRQFDDNVPVLWAVEDNGDISFYCYHDICVPTDIAMG